MIFYGMAPGIVSKRDIGKHILTLASLPFTEQQLTALEAAFREVQEDVIGWLFSLMDGSSQPPGWPDALRLVNMDTGEVVCPEALEWEFGLALANYRARLDQETRASPDETPHALDRTGAHRPRRGRADAGATRRRGAGGVGAARRR